MSFLLYRILSFILASWLAVTLAFFALRLLPGDAIQNQLLRNGVSEAVIGQRRESLGLNDPLGLQYLRYLAGLVRGDFGYSLVDGQPVLEMIGQQFPPTIELATGAMLVAIISGVIWGVISAANRNRALSNTANLLMSLSLSMPIYWTGTLAIFFFSSQLGWLPSTGAGRFSQLILPVSVLGFQSAGVIARLTQNSVSNAAQQDFVRTARSKGLPEYQVLLKHILRVGLLPIVTAILLQTGFLFSGTVITENLFLRPGIGRLLFDRVLQQDYPAVQGIVILFALIHILLSTLGDLIYPLLDPRVTATS